MRGPGINSQRLRKRSLTSRLFQRTDRDEILITDVADVVRGQRDECLCPARSGYELDLKGIRSIDFDDGSKITSPQAGIGNVTRQYNSVEKVEHDSPRENGHQTWKVLFRTDDPHSSDASRSPRCCGEDTIDFELAPIRRWRLADDAS